MQWTDEGIVIGAKRHGEANAILELMTREHGRHLGLVRGGFGSRLKPVLQPGNTVSASMACAARRASRQLHGRRPVVCGRRVSFRRSHAIYGVTHLAALMRLLPERDPHAGLYEALDEILGHLNDAVLAAPMVVRFELQLLSELGFGLDLETCVATGGSGDLVYVSPKSGRAVSRSAGEPWADKMLRLPAFLREERCYAHRPRSGRRVCADRLFPDAPCAGAARSHTRDERAHFIAALNRALPSVA